ncbi:MAG: acetyl-CoA hydrolase [Deltaproteobacteria bacterium HGW-Deltaproteobacteria-19]|jgi:4-hydroxybutyrate CoA-transferase|nr:MAG: acetyl-CoA hydrolase [Deltaproteobacteria bacterium HGW-Deltaproteobacteria-19]
MDWKEEYKQKSTSLAGAAAQIRNNDFVGIGLAVGSCSPAMFDAILDRGKELKGVRICDSVAVRPSRLYDLEFMKGLDGHINFDPSFGTGASRKIIESRLPDYLPLMSSEGGDKYAKRSDVFICMTTPPNSQGFINLGLTNFYTMEAIRKGRAEGKLRLAIAEVNDQMPTIYGNNWMNVSEFDVFVENSTPIPKVGRATPGEREKKIGDYALELLKNGDTIQMGIGAIPEAVVAGLEGKHDLGVLTEMFPIGLPQLVEKGIVTNAKKPFHKGVTVATFCMGDQSMYDYVHENPVCEFYPSSYTNSPAFIAQHPNMVAMNMAMMVDMSGQIASEGIGHRMVSGVGGQLDFMVGTFYSEGGRGITMLYSSRKLKDGSFVSAIMPELPPGTPVSVPRFYAQYVVTEYGIADIRYKTRRERGEALINIAHPDLRGELRNSLKKNFYMSK